MALTSDHKVTGWGNNDFGQSHVPESIEGKTIMISTGLNFSLALTKSYTVEVWGINNCGQCHVPKVIQGKVIVVSAG